ncbi:MAG: hypothetical protein HY044_04940 [Candidatus Woesebacteria bacterium]|nr:MAG: hypothetical protein HY044_04940 [Candidatus Woesebacteria bacterium]
MVKKIFLIILSIFLLLPRSILAQDSQSAGSSGTIAPSIMPVRRPPSNPNFLGQSQYYSVTFRGNGEAVVSAKIVFSNLDSKQLSEMQLQIPKVNPNDLTVYQVLAEPSCIRYGVVPQGTLYIQPPCLEYQEPDYFQYYGNNKYQKADFNLKGDTLNISLPTPVKENKSGAFFVYFRANGYASKNILGAWNFNFETLKVDDKIQNLQVGISTDSDLFLKGGQGQINYRTNEIVSSLKMDAGSAAPAASPSFDNFYNQIGNGAIIKNASSLGPSETYKVAGIYADSQIKLYLREIGMGIAVFVGVIVTVSLVGFVLYKILKSRSFEKTNKVVVIFLVSLGSSIFASLYTGLIFAGFNYFSRNFYIYSNSQFFPLIALLVLVISLIVYGILIFGAAAFIYSKYGLGASIANLFLTLIFITLFLGIGILLLILFGQKSTPIVYPITPLAK